MKWEARPWGTDAGMEEVATVLADADVRFLSGEDELAQQHHAHNNNSR